MVTQHSNYRSYLKSVLEERSARNPKYSLRAMAKQIGVSAATLSHVLNGQKNLSLETAEKISQALQLKDQDLEIFLLLVQLETTSSDDLRFLLLNRLKERGGQTNSEDLSLDHFRIISDWYHYAIMRLTEVDGVLVSPAQLGAVAKILGITRVEATLAVERLLKLEMLELKSGRYVKVVANPRATAVSPNAALRNHHRQVMQKAIESLEDQTPAEKFIASETVAIDSSLLKKFESLTEEYISKVLTLANSKKTKNHVYQLGLQFFKLTKKKEEL